MAAASLVNVNASIVFLEDTIKATATRLRQTYCVKPSVAP